MASGEEILLELEAREKTATDPQQKAIITEMRKRIMGGLPNPAGPALQQAPPPVASSPEEPPVSVRQQIGESAAQAGRGLQIAGASLAKGLASVPGMPSDLTELTVNALSSYARARSGDPTVGPDPVNVPLGTEELLKYLPDALQVPKNLSPFEQVASTTLEVTGAAAVPIALATKLLTYADPRKVAQLEMLLAASGGFTMGVVHEVFGGSPVADFIGLLAGSFGPQAVMKMLSKARRVVLDATGLRSEEEVQKEIGKELGKLTTPEELEKGIKKSEALSKDMEQEGSPGFKPTTGQVSGSPGLIQSERAFTRMSGEKTGKAKQTLAANQAVVGKFVRDGAPEGKLEDTVQALEAAMTRETAMIDASLIRAQADVDSVKQKVSATTERIIQQADERAQRAESAAQDRVNALRGRISKGEAGKILRDEYKKELDAFDAEAGARYQQVPNFSFDPSVLSAKIAELKADFGVEIQGLASSGLAKVSAIVPELSEVRQPAGFLAQSTTQPQRATTFHQLHQARNEVRRLRREAIAATDFKSAYQLGRINDAIADTMDAVKATPPPGAEAAISRLQEVDEWYGKQVARLKSGEVNALRFKDKWGRFATYDEDVAAQFLAGETPVNDFIQSIGSRGEAREALREFAKRDFIEKAVYPELHPQAGHVNQASAARWVQKHEDALKLFPEVREEIGDAVKWEKLAGDYRKESDAILKNPDAVAKARNPKVYGDLDEVTRKQADLLDLRERTVKGWEKSVASDLMGLDADRAAQGIVRSMKPRTVLADLEKRIGPSQEGQNGLNKALWDAALDRFAVEMLDAGNNPVLQAKKMHKFLNANEDWMVQRFGQERVNRMRKGAEGMAMLEGTGRPVLPGGSDTFSNVSSVLTDWGPFLSRLYAEQRGIVNMQWLISERTARIIGKALKGRAEENVAELLERAFYEPQVAQTWILASKNASEQLLQQRFRNYLLPKAYIGTEAIASGDE